MAFADQDGDIMGSERQTDAVLTQIRSGEVIIIPRVRPKPVVSLGLDDIERHNERLLNHFSDRMVVDTKFTRALVSFQANKERGAYRWFKFKEAFSVPLVEFFVNKYNISPPRVLDPFAGSGTVLFAASHMGLEA